MASLIEFPQEEFPFLGSTESDSREPGLHVTEIILDLMHTLRLAQFDAEVTEDLRKNWERGFRWEDALMVGFHGKLAPRPEPFQADGIWMSPDGFDELREVVCEYKSTKKSLRAWHEWTSLDDPKWMYWVWQAKAYCYGLIATKVRWFVMFENGDYSKGAATAREFDASRGAEFEQWELEEFWEMLLNHKRTMEARDAELP